MTIIKDTRTGYYKARVRTLLGTTRTVTTKAKTKAEARRIVRKSHLAEIEEATKAGRLAEESLVRIVIGKRVSFAEAVQEYERRMRNRGRSVHYIRATMCALSMFGRHSGLTDKPITSLQEEMVDAFVNRTDTNTGAAQRTNQRSILTRFCEFLTDKGWALGNPAKLTCVRMDKLSHDQKERHVREPFTDTEVAALLARCEPGSFWHAAITLGRWTGLRLGDIATLEWASLQTPGKIAVWTAKRSKRVELDIHPDLERSLAAVVKNPATEPSRYVFPKEAAIANDPRTRPNLSTYFRRLCEKAAVPNRGHHSLRRAYASYCFKNGISVEHIRTAMGHSTEGMTRHYISPV